MYMAHLGVAVFIIGVSLSEGMKAYYEGVNSTGDNIKISNFNVYFSKIDRIKKRNWLSETRYSL